MSPLQIRQVYLPHISCWNLYARLLSGRRSSSFRNWYSKPPLHIHTQPPLRKGRELKNTIKSNKIIENKKRKRKGPPNKTNVWEGKILTSGSDHLCYKGNHRKWGKGWWDERKGAIPPTPEVDFGILLHSLADHSCNNHRLLRRNRWVVSACDLWLWTEVSLRAIEFVEITFYHRKTSQRVSLLILFLNVLRDFVTRSFWKRKKLTGFSCINFKKSYFFIYKVLACINITF